MNSGTSSSASLRPSRLCVKTQPTQFEFDQLLLALPSNRPLVPLAVAMVLLNRNEDGVLTLIDDGRIPWAFDLKTPGADRRKIHIHRDSLEHAKASPSPLRGEGRGEVSSSSYSPTTLSHLLQRTVPRGAGALVTVRALADCCNCSPTHIYNLGLSGCLELISKARTGPNGSALIDRLSVISFLTHRRVK